MNGRLAAALVLACAVGGAWTARAHLVATEAAGRGSKELLYLPNGKHLEVLSLGNAPLVADFVYLWAIQYYSDYARADRYRYVEHVFGNVVAELDPHFIDPYWLGAVILSVEAHDLDGALRLLDKGFKNNPREWILLYLAGWECAHAKEFDRAADYFDAAARVPGAPASLERLKAGMIARSGDLEGAIALWKAVLDDPRGDDAARAIARRQIRTLLVRIDLSGLEAGVAAYRAKHDGRPPGALADLVVDGEIRSLPLDPDGNAYAYDPRSGAVTSAATRILDAP